MSYHPSDAMKNYPPGDMVGAQTSSQRFEQNYGGADPLQPPPYGAVDGAGAPPPPYSMEKVPGYENATFENAVSPPPPTAPDSNEVPAQRTATVNLPQTTDEDAREAVINFASDNCCYGNAAAREMTITDITMNNALHYSLESFGEKRQSAWRFVPYTGQPIDGPNNGPAPTPWNIPLNPPENFRTTQIKVEVPHTAFVKPCHVCVGNGRVRCERCLGTGRINSSGATSPNRCYGCGGRGQVQCDTCSGTGNLKGFVELTVTWTNHTGYNISETTNMPKELVLNSVSQIILQEDMTKVIPVTDSGSHIKSVSEAIIAKHDQSFPNERILRQRQMVRVVPIAYCSFKWKDESGDFSVYGLDRKVYFPSYPQKYCCGCTIL